MDHTMDHSMDHTASKDQTASHQTAITKQQKLQRKNRLPTAKVENHGFVFLNIKKRFGTVSVRLDSVFMYKIPD